MFSFLRSRNTSTSETVDGSHSNATNSNATSDADGSHEKVKLEPISIDFDVEIGGGKGYPTGIDDLCYHTHLSILVLTTDCGSIYSYGDNFQYLRQRVHDDEQKIVSVLPMYPDRLFVAFEDNSVHVYSLPKIHFLDSLKSDWLPERYGNIVYCYNDEPSCRGYVYVVTSDGTIHVLDATGAIRVCDYQLPLSKVNLPAQSTIVDIKSCPKDERYIAIAYKTSDTASSVIVYDLAKNKIYRQYPNDHLVTSLSWSHTGEVLYAACDNGDLLSIITEKQTTTVIYNTKSSQHANDTSIGIKKLHWLAPQPVTGLSCLFLELSEADLDTEQDEIGAYIGLSPTGKNGELQEVYTMGNIPYKNIKKSLLVPLSPASSGDSTSEESIRIDLGFLCLTSSHSVPKHHDSAVSCPLSIIPLPHGPIAEWNSTVTPEEFIPQSLLPGNRSKLTCINASIPITSGNCLISVLLNSYDTIKSSNPISAAFTPMEPYYISHNDFTRFINHNSVDLLLAPGVFTSVNAVTSDSRRPQDVIFAGYEDGTVIAWGVSRPPDKSIDGRNNIYLPLACLKNSKVAITAIEFDEAAGLLLVGDCGGNLVIWEVYDSEKDVGYLQAQYGTLFPTSAEEGGPSNEGYDSDNEIRSDDGSGSDTGHGHSGPTSPPPPSQSHDMEEESRQIDMSMFKPSSLRLHATKTVKHGISQLKYLSDYMTLVIGTVTGELYTLALYDDDSEHPINVNLTANYVPGVSPAATAKYESVSYLWASAYFHLGVYIPVVYVTFGISTVVVLNVLVGEVLSYAIIPAADLSTASSHSSIMRSSREQVIAYGCALDSNEALVTLTSVPIPSLSDLLSFFGKERSHSITAASNTSQSSTALSPVTNKRSVLGGMFSSNSNGSSGASSPTPGKSTMQQRQSVSVPLPNESPKSVLLLIGRKLFRLSLVKFSPPKKLTGGLFSSTSSLDQQITGGTPATMINQRVITTSNIITGCVVNYIEESTRAWSQPIPCLLAVNCEANVLFIRLADKLAIGHVSLFDKVLSSPLNIATACALQNGNTYFVYGTKAITASGGTMIYSGRPVSSTHMLSHPLPTKAIYLNSIFMKQNIAAMEQNIEKTPMTTCQLVTGRDSSCMLDINVLNNTSATAATNVAPIATKKKRSSIMSSFTGVTNDIDKIFLKSREKRDKDELFDRSSSISSNSSAYTSDDEDFAKVEPEVSLVQVRQASTNTKSTLQTMNETKQALELRGEKIQMLAKQSDEVRNAALDFHQNAKLLKTKSKGQSIFGMF